MPSTHYPIDSPESDYLYTSVSQIPFSGKGLLTAIKIFNNEIIAVFEGEILSNAEANIRVLLSQDHYFISLLNGKIMDSNKTECFAKYANDAEGVSSSLFKNNAKIAMDENQNVCLIAIRNIKAGEEIFCSYGKRYWQKHG